MRAATEPQAALETLFVQVGEPPKDETPEGARRARAAARERLAALRGFDASRLPPDARLDYDSVLFGATIEAELAHFPFGVPGPTAAPYVVTPRNGAYLTVGKGRPEDVAATLDGETARLHDDARQGVRPPVFIIGQTLARLRTAQAKAPSTVAEALGRQMAALEDISRHASQVAGVWRLKQGNAYYALALKAGATDTVSPEAVHRDGWREARRLSRLAGALLGKQGFTRGGTGERLHALAQDPRFLYSDDDAGRAAALKDMNGWLALVRPRMPEVFSYVSPGDLSVKLAGPAEIGYRVAPSYDGRKPGAYYVDLRQIRRRPRWSLHTVVHHEINPGHLIQLPLQEHASPPPLRLRYAGTAFSEGWAIYAEQLADELGLFDDDPLGRIGYLQSVLVRLGRQIVDTGIHHFRWNREKAIKTFADICGDAPELFETEVDRMIVQPGYTPGHALARTKILALRQAAKAKPDFTLKAFHDAVLKRGAMPLAVLPKAVGRVA